MSLNCSFNIYQEQPVTPGPVSPQMNKPAYKKPGAIAPLENFQIARLPTATLRGKEIQKERPGTGVRKRSNFTGRQAYIEQERRLSMAWRNKGTGQISHSSTNPGTIYGSGQYVSGTYNNGMDANVWEQVHTPASATPSWPDQHAVSSAAGEAMHPKALSAGSAVAFF